MKTQPLSSHLRLYLFGLFIHLHIYRTVSAPSIPLGPFLFCLSIRLFAFAFAFPAPSVFLFIVPTEQFKACWPCLILNRPRVLMIMSLCCYFKVTPFFFYPFILLFCFFTDFLFSYILFCLLFSFQFSSSLG